MKKNEESKQSKMSLAAKKAWETRRKNSGKKPSESGKERMASEVREEAEITVEQLRRACRKGELVRKRYRKRKNGSVMMDDKMQAFLYGSKWIEEVIVRKLVNQSMRLAKELIWRDEGQKQLVVA